MAAAFKRSANGAHRRARLRRVHAAHGDDLLAGAEDVIGFAAARDDDVLAGNRRADDFGNPAPCFGDGDLHGVSITEERLGIQFAQPRAL